MFAHLHALHEIHIGAREPQVTEHEGVPDAAVPPKVDKLPPKQLRRHQVVSPAQLDTTLQATGKVPAKVPVLVCETPPPAGFGFGLRSQRNSKTQRQPKRNTRAPVWGPEFRAVKGR